MKVIILGAGQGKRLLPLTEDVPKALLDIGGRRLVERQVDAFVASGIKEFVVITGYAHDAMQEALSGLASELNVEIRTVYNPFFAVADNLASCWMARQEMTGDFIQVNGDNLFKPDLVEHFLSAPHREVTVAVSHKGSYDADDMKVMMDGERVTEIGKMLPLEAVDAEAMGFYLFTGEGGPKFVEVIERMMHDPSGLKHWYPTAVGVLAKSTPVHSWSFDEHEWCEVDFPADLQFARQIVARW